MAKNSKPILSVLIEEDKRTKFADLARRHSLSMGWLVNQAIDRMLDADSIDIYRDSIERVSAGLPIESLVPASIDNTDIETLVSKSIGKYLQNNSVGFTHQEVRDIAAATIKDSIAFERLCNEGAVINVAEKIVNSAFNPLSQAIVKLEADTCSQFAAVRDEIERAISNRSVTTEAVATVPDPVSPTDDGVEYLSFHQLATQLGYVLPVELKDKTPQVRATALIAYAATLGQSYGWNGKKQKLYRTEV